MGKSWGNHGKMMGHMWIEWTIDGTCRTCSINNNPQRCRTYPLTPGFTLFGIFFWVATIKKHMSQICAKHPKKNSKQHTHNHKKKHGVHLKPEHMDLLTEKHAVQQEQIEHVDVQ